LELPRGSRCLLLGANGAGKSTLLRILAGKHMHQKDEVLVLGQPAFYQTLGLSGVSLLGGGWTRTIAFAGNNIPYQADIKVGDMMADLQKEFSERRNELYTILEIDPSWRMHQVSDGQRRRVQIMLGLLRPFKLLLIDEMTVDLDVLARRSFLSYLEKESNARGATIVYATHIFDGLEGFATDIVLLEGGKMVRNCKYDEIKKEPSYEGLYGFIVSFLEQMLVERQAKEKLKKESDINKPQEEKSEVQPFATPINCGYTPGRMMGYFK